MYVVLYCIVLYLYLYCHVMSCHVMYVCTKLYNHGFRVISQLLDVYNHGHSHKSDLNCTPKYQEDPGTPKPPWSNPLALSPRIFPTTVA